MRSAIRFSISVVILLLSNSVFSSDDVINTKIQNTLSKNTEINSSQLNKAQDWQLTEVEWHHYLNLMQGTSGHYYKQLSPPEVLGINADSPEEIHHFAEISAQLEHDKLDRELKFNKAFHEAAARLYASEQIIKPFDLTPFTPIPKSLN